MTELNCLNKMKKPLNLPIEPLKKPVSSQRSFRPKRKPTLYLEAKSLSLQKIKRINAAGWHFRLPERIQSRKRVCKALGQALKLDKSTQELVLSSNGFHSGFKLADEDLNNFANNLKGLKSFRGITVYVGECHSLTDTGLSYLMKGLQRLYWLKRISLNLAFPREITYGCFDSISQSLRKMKFLESLYLRFWSDVKVTERGLCKLSGSFNRLTKLRDISFKTPYSHMTDVCLANMTIKRQVFLQKVYLSFEGCDKLTGRGLSFLAQDLTGLPGLQRIDLKFWECCRFSDEGLHYLWQMMSLPSLRAVTLTFSRCSKITDAAFFDLAETLKSLIPLQELELAFYYCSEITDFGVGALCQALERFESLQSLSLYFGWNFQITDTGVKKIIDGMSRLINLQNIEIGISGTRKITEVSLRSIVKFVKSRNSLEKVTVRMLDMSGTTDKEIDDFSDEMRNLERQRPYLRVEYIN